MRRHSHHYQRLDLYSYPEFLFVHQLILKQRHTLHFGILIAVRRHY